MSSWGEFDQYAARRPATILWTIAFSVAMWVPLLALEIGYPSVEQFFQVPTLQRIFGYAAAVCAAVFLTAALPPALAARALGTGLQAQAVALPASICGAAVSSALFLLRTAALVRRGPGPSLAADVNRAIVVMVFSALIGAIVTGIVVAAARRLNRSWIILLLAVPPVLLWAYLARMLVGVSATGRPLNLWLIGLAALLVASAAHLERAGRSAAVAAALVLLVVACLPAIRVTAASRDERPGPKVGAGRPNVVVVLIDTWRYDMTGLADPSAGTTPRLDALVRERSTVFRAAASPAPATLPSVKAMITGLPATHFGLDETASEDRAVKGRKNTETKREDVFHAFNAAQPPPKNAWVMARAFLEAGYATSAFSANDLVATLGFESGYQEFWCVAASRSVERSFFLNVLLARRNYWQAHRLAGALRIAKTDGDAVVDRFERWLAERDDRPFFSYVHLFEPHWPYSGDRSGGPEALPEVDLLQVKMGDPANAKYRSAPGLQDVLRRYRGEVAEADRLLGRVVDLLRAKNLLDETVLLVVGDHGEEFFEHNGFGHGHDVYEELLHVPFVVRWPRAGSFDGFARDVTTPVSLIDVFPTLTDLLNLPRPRTPFVGRSLRSELTARPETVGVIAESIWGNARVSYRRGSLKARYTFDPRFPPARSGRTRLYDLAVDPHELKPVKLPDSRYTPFLAEANAAVTKLWGRALSQTAGIPARGPDPNADEALERLRALGYLR